MERRPEISVVVPSHDRPLRLRWLLNALEEQTLAPERFEVVVAYDPSRAETEVVLREHPLGARGVLRSVALRPGTVPPGKSRNAAWRLARASLIAFTDDDCRPPPEWLERALDAAARSPGAIVQGATRPDPEEASIQWARHVRTQSVRPPGPWAQAGNIVYPRDTLESLGGLAEDMHVGEDTDLAERARAAGVPYVGAEEVVTSHAIDEVSALGTALDAWRLRGLPLLLARHPRLRAEFPAGLFLKREHIWLPMAVAAVALGRRSRLAPLLAVPYLAHAIPRGHGSSPRPRVRAFLDVPGLALVHGAEMASLAWGSVRHRTLFL